MTRAAPRDLHRRARRAARARSAGSSTTEVRPYVDEWEAAGHFPDSLFRRCGELGFLGLHYPARVGRQRRRPRRGHRVRRGARARCGAARSRWRSRCRPTWRRRRSPSSAPTTSASAGCAPRSPARRSARSRSPSPTRLRRRRDPHPRRARRRRVARQRPKMFITNGTRAHFLTLVARKTDADGSGHRGVSLFIVDTVAAGRVGVAQARQARHAVAATPPRSRSTTWPCPHDELIGGRTGPGLRAADVAAPVRTARGRGRVRRSRRRRCSRRRSSTPASARRSAGRSPSTR